MYVATSVPVCCYGNSITRELKMTSSWDRCKPGYRRHCDDSDEMEEDLGGFLHDPALWVDRLPQPFRAIDEILQELFGGAWEAIEARSIQRERERARVKVPEASDAHLVAAVEGVNSISSASGGGGLVFVGSSSGLGVLCAREGEKGAELLVQRTGVDVMRLETACSKDVHFVAVLLQNGVKVFAYIQSRLVYLTDFPTQDEKRQTSITFSPSSTHLALTTLSPDGYQLEVYELPVDAWHKELQEFLTNVSATAAAGEEASGSHVSEGSQPEEGDLTYSKASLVLTVYPPKLTSPCTAADPATALQSAFEGSMDSIASGEHHILTQKYFESRRKAFISRRADFVSENPKLTNSQQSSPTCHFLYYKNGKKQVAPSDLVVWWNQHTQLLFYSLKGSTKGAAVPHKVYPQASMIVSSIVSADGSLLAVGLQSGVVLIWNQRTGLCSQAASAVSLPDSISVMEFLPGDTMDPVLAMGTKQGEVLVIPSDYQHSKDTNYSVSHRVSKQQEIYASLFSSSGYDSSSEVLSLKANPALSSVITSLHCDGSVILWSLREREALCRLKLPQSFVVCNALCTFSGGGDYAFIAGKPHDQEVTPNHTSLFSMHLRPLLYLTPYWSTPPPPHSLEDNTTEQLTMMEIMEKRLATFIKLKCEERCTDVARQQKRWNEFAQELVQHA